MYTETFVTEYNLMRITALKNSEQNLTFCLKKTEVELWAVRHVVQSDTFQNLTRLSNLKCE